ncbi:MAG: hypothetical protein MUF73_09185 [Rhodobacteraceae bacterium]|jgi:hypothetical protein|nr:hypothetical protein [Paracoccaceae bacterium]
MFEAFLVTTSTEGLRALGSAPQRSFELVTGTIRARLGPRHAALFAEPVPTRFGDRFDWHATVAGTARRLADLPESEAAPVRAAREALAGDIRALAAGIAATGAPDDLRLAEALANALVVPDDTHVWVVEGPAGPQPVLVQWAWDSDARAVVGGALAGTDPRPRPAVAPVAAPVVGTGAGAFGLLWALWGLGWLILALMTAAILWLMIPACGLRGGVSFCPAAAALAPVAPADTLRIADEIARLELRLADADRACQPQPPPAPVLPPPPVLPPAPVALPELPEPAPAPPTGIDRRLDDAGAMRGELTFSLAWNSDSDLDLHITCPDGGRIFFGTRAACGGVLDIDMNAGAQRTTAPVENTYFAAPAPGVYGIGVRLFRSATGGAPEPFQVQVRDGDRVMVLQGTVSPGSPDWVADHNHGGN